MEVLDICIVVTRGKISFDSTPNHPHGHVLIVSEIVGKVLVRDHYVLRRNECDSHVVKVGVLVGCVDQWAWCAQCIDGKQVVRGVTKHEFKTSISL